MYLHHDIHIMLKYHLKHWKDMVRGNSKLVTNVNIQIHFDRHKI